MINERKTMTILLNYLYDIC